MISAETQSKTRFKFFEEKVKPRNHPTKYLFEKRHSGNLFAGRGGKLLDTQQQIKDSEDLCTGQKIKSFNVGWVERERNPFGGFPLRSYPPYIY